MTGICVIGAPRGDAYGILGCMQSGAVGLRAVTIVGIAALLTWLVADRGGTTAARRRAVNDALQRHAIRPVATGEMAQFVSTVRWLAVAAGVREPIVVNVPFSPRLDHRLHVFTTTPAAATVTRCGLGNAVYDAELDAIFVDHDIIHSMDWDRMLAQTELGFRDIPSLRVYTRFVLLHELGHRVLHRRSGGFFDVAGPAASGDQQRREREADHFATMHMPGAYAIARRFAIEPVEEYTGDTIQVRVTPTMPLDDQVQVSLVEMANVVTLGTEILSRGRSAFVSTLTHPSVVQRARGLIAAAATRPSKDPKLRALVAYTRARLDSIQLAGTQLVDVAADRPIRSVVVQQNRLLIAAANAPQLRAFALPRLHARLPGSATTADGRLMLLRAPVRPQLAASVAGWFVSIHDEEIEAIAPATGERRVVPLHLTPSDRPKALYATDTGRWAVLQTETDTTRTVYVLDAASFAIVQRLSAADLTTGCTRAAGVAVARPSLDDAVFTGSTLLLPLQTASTPNTVEEFVGIAELALPSLAVRTVRRVQFPPDIGARTDGPNTRVPSESGRRVLTVIPGAGTARVALVNLVRTTVRPEEPSLPTRVEVWELHERAPARLVMTRGLMITMLLDAFTPADLRTGVALAATLESVRGVAPATVIVNLAGDSVYTVDLDSGAIRVVFHPGGSYLSIATGDSPVAVITGPQSYDPWTRAFVLFMSATSR